MRGQANLLSLGVALLLVSGAVGFGLGVADDALVDADRDARERHAAVALSDRLVAGDGPLSLDGRPNVLARAALLGLDGDALRDRFRVAAAHDVTVRLDGDVVAQTGDIVGGTSIRRVVLVATEQRRVLEPVLASTPRSVTLPRRTSRIVLELSPPPATTLRTVYANGRVVLHDRSGIVGRYDVRVSRFDSTTLRFVADGPLPRGSVRIVSFPARATKGELVVTVDA